MGKPEGKRPLGIPRCSWEDSIKMDLSGSRIWGHGLGRAEGQVADTCECRSEPSVSIKYGESVD